MVICPYCGQRNHGDREACGFCGGRLVTEVKYVREERKTYEEEWESTSGSERKTFRNSGSASARTTGSAIIWRSFSEFGGMGFPIDAIMFHGGNDRDNGQPTEYPLTQRLSLFRRLGTWVKHFFSSQTTNGS